MEHIKHQYDEQEQAIRILLNNLIGAVSNGINTINTIKNNQPLNLSSKQASNQAVNHQSSNQSIQSFNSVFFMFPSPSDGVQLAIRKETREVPQEDHLIVTLRRTVVQTETRSRFHSVASTTSSNAYDENNSNFTDSESFSNISFHDIPLDNSFSHLHDLVHRSPVERVIEQNLISVLRSSPLSCPHPSFDHPRSNSNEDLWLHHSIASTRLSDARLDELNDPRSRWSCVRAFEIAAATHPKEDEG